MVQIQNNNLQIILFTQLRFHILLKSNVNKGPTINAQSEVLNPLYHLNWEPTDSRAY